MDYRARIDSATEPIELNTLHPAWRGKLTLSPWPAVILAAVIGLVLTLLR